MEELFAWIRRTQPREFSAEFEGLLCRTLEGLPPAGPLRSEILRILQGHPFHWERVRQWPELYRDLRQPLDVLLEDLHAQAAELPDRLWRTLRFRRFARCRANAQMLDQVQAEVEAAWSEYLARPLASSEVTLESVAGHQLLVEGLAAWMEAVEQARVVPDDEAALESAERGCRLLATVQIFSTCDRSPTP